jgi:hypothetical protein
MATALQHVNTPLPLPRQVNPNLPEGIELVLIKALAKDPALRYESMEALNRAFQAALAAALDPARYAAADGKTITSQRTLAMYRKYQNVTPRARQGRTQRSLILATLLLLLACTVSAGAIAVIRPELFSGASAQSSQLSDAEIQATIEARLATALAAGTTMPTGALETEIYSTVLAVVEATRIAGGGPSSTPSETATATATATTAGGVALPTIPPSPTRTLRPGETPPTSTKSPVPSATPTLGPTSAATATATVGSTSLPTSTEPPTAVPSATSPGSTSAPTATPVPPTSTLQPPSSTPQPPTSTPQPPTPTRTRTPTRTPQTPQGQLTQDAKKTKTAAAQTEAAQPTSTP